MFQTPHQLGAEKTHMKGSGLKLGDLEVDGLGPLTLSRNGGLSKPSSLTYRSVEALVNQTSLTLSRNGGLN